MKLEKWALVAEIVSAIAIVLSLVFVGLQVRQGASATALNTRAIEVAAYQNLTFQASALNSLVIESPQVADLYLRMIAKREQPASAVEYQQIRAYLLMAYRQGEMAFRQYRSGLIDEASLVSILGNVRVYIQTPVGAEIWRRQGLDETYQQYVDSLPTLAVRSFALPTPTD